MKQIKNVKKQIKNVVDKLQNYSNHMKKLFSKIIVIVYYSVHDNVSELWLFIREFPMAAISAILNPSLKSRFL